MFNFGTATAGGPCEGSLLFYPTLLKVEGAEPEQLLIENADAELSVTTESPVAFQPWVRTVVNTLVSS